MSPCLHVCRESDATEARIYCPFDVNIVQVPINFQPLYTLDSGSKFAHDYNVPVTVGKCKIRGLLLQDLDSKTNL
jgi:hypothetical protein